MRCLHHSTIYKHSTGSADQTQLETERKKANEPRCGDWVLCIKSGLVASWLEDLRFCGVDVIIIFDILSNYDGLEIF